MTGTGTPRSASITRRRRHGGERVRGQRDMQGGILWIRGMQPAGITSLTLVLLIYVHISVHWGAHLIRTIGYNLSDSFVPS